jgi:hypothetical protein
MAVRYGFAADEIDVIVDTLLHLPVTSHDPLSLRDPGARRVARALENSRIRPIRS